MRAAHGDAVDHACENIRGGGATADEGGAAGHDCAIGALGSTQAELQHGLALGCQTHTR